MDSEGEDVKIQSIEAIKVCGITYSNNEDTANHENIIDKITFQIHCGGTIDGRSLD